MNGERIACAMHQRRILVVSAVGHESDYLRKSLFADHGTPTSSTTVEAAGPDYGD